MRFTIPSPARPGDDLDIEVEAGLPVDTLRRRLALLTGDPRWAAPPGGLEVADRVLDDRHPVGAPPLVPGAHLAPGTPPDDDATAAARSRLHAAVLTGPATGRLVPLPDSRRVTFAPDPNPGQGRGPEVRRHARLEIRRSGDRVRVRARGLRGEVRVPRRRPARTHGTAPLTARARRIGPLGRRWPVGAELRVAGTTLHLRGPEQAEPVDGRVARHLPAWAWSAVASTTLALVLAAVLRQPFLLLTAVTGVAGLLALRAHATPGAPAAHPGTPQSVPPADLALPPGTVADVAALRVATARRLHDRAGPVPGDDHLWPVDRTIALLGPRDVTLAAARALVLRTLGAGTARRLVVRSGAPGEWRWARWWEPSPELPGPEHDDVLVVCDGIDDRVAAWRLGAPRARLLLVVPPDGRPPAWASTLVIAGPSAGRSTDEAAAPRRARRTVVRAAGHRGTKLVRTEPVGTELVGTELVATALADAQGRSAAALAWVLAADGRQPRSEAAPVLGALPGVPDPVPSAVAAAWDRATDPGTLRVPLGVAAEGRPVVVDLVRDGPHALVAGTTGAGKSELLTTLVLGAALTCPPQRLALLLVDFKGGTGLGPVAGLPHVVDHVHDLDVAAAHRLLVGLRAELRRRERILAAAGATDLADLDAAERPARLLVVVDELRALVDDLPQAAATLARLAAQGRALGVHLVLATQRPAGAVPPDLRANVGLRIALRVADEDDSRDVVGCPDAARIDVASPGHALMRVGARPPVGLRVARARHRPSAPPVRLVPDLASRSPGWRAPQPPAQDVADWVEACRAAARGRPGPSVPWSAALPARVVAEAPGPDPSALLVAVADVPDEQRHVDVLWRPGHGPLLVLGGPRSGRSTTLATVGTHALLTGAHVHALGLPDDVVAHLRSTRDQGVGTAAGTDDVHRTLLLLHRLSARQGPDVPATVLLVDGLDVLLETLAAPARGAGADLLHGLLRNPPPRVHVAATSAVTPAIARLTGAFGTRVVLPVPDASLDLQAGVPQSLAGPRRTPGRAVVLAPEGALLCQVVLPASRPVAATTGARPDDADVGAGRTPVRVGRMPARSSPPPRDPYSGPVPAGTRIPLGTGGDAPGPVALRTDRPLVVTGPPGAGRTAALLTVGAGWAAAGRRVVLVTSTTAPGPVLGPDLPARGTVTVAPPAAVEPFLDTLGHRGAAHRSAGPGLTGGAEIVLLLDDVDQLERRDPLLADHLEQLVRRPTDEVRVVALATTSDHAVVALRGPVAAAMRARLVLVLDPHGTAAQDLLGPDGALLADPAHRPPGRGVLRDERVLVRVQVHQPDTPAGSARPAG